MSITKREPGRPTLCTPEIVDMLVARVRSGVPINRACGAAGISQTSFYEWMRRAELGEEPYAQFADRVTQAKSELLCDLAAGVTSAALWGDVKAAQWILERADRHNWSKSADTVVNVNSETRREHVIDASVTVEQLEAQLEEIDQ